MSEKEKFAVKILQNARGLITHPKMWTTGTYCRDDEGRASGDKHFTKATCFCALGAFNETTFRDEDLNSLLLLSRERQSAIDALYSSAKNLASTDERFIVNHDNAIAFVNDTMGHEHVLRMYDEAILNLELSP